MTIETVVAFVGFFASVSSIVFAYLAFKRSKEQDNKISGKNEGVMFSDITRVMLQRLLQETSLRM